MKLVKVKWHDAYGDDRQLSTEDARTEFNKPCVVYTVGWLLEKNKRCVILAGERLPDDQYRTFTHIPRGMVKSIVSLTGVK